MTIITSRRKIVAATGSLSVASIAGCADTNDPEGQQSGDEEATEFSEEIQLIWAGLISTGSPPLTSANFRIDLSELDDDTFDTTENLQFELRNQTTGEELLIDPEEPIVEKLKRDEIGDLGDIVFGSLFEPTGEIAAEPALSINLEEVPVVVTGDRTLLRNESIVNSYQATILDDGDLLFETPPQQLATQYPDGFVQIAAGDTLKYSFKKRELRDFSPRIVIHEVMDNGNNSIVGSVESDGTNFVATFDAAEFTDEAAVEFRSPDMNFYTNEAAAEDDERESKVFSLSGPGVELDHESLDGALSATVDNVETDVSVGEAVTVDYTVTNIGEANSSDFRQVELYTLPENSEIPEDEQDDEDLPILSPGESVSGSLEFTTSESDSGRLTLLISAGSRGNRKVGTTTITVE